jgi:cation:H+ antiporter
VGIAIALTVPWTLLFVGTLFLPAGRPVGVLSELFGIPAGDGVQVLISGIAILGASFLLAWAAETAEEDVPRAFALAVLAVLAVAPEYAVDALYAFGAGSGGASLEACSQYTAAQMEAAASGTVAEACHESNLAVANMTGANRILIGLGWSGIAIFTVWRATQTNDSAVEERSGFLANVVTLDKGISTEIAFLFAATLWAFLVPLGGGIDVFDTVALVGLYVAYIGIIVKAGAEAEEEHVGVPAYFQEWAFPRRVAVVLFLFLYSAAMIMIAVEPFAKGLEHLGADFGIPEFFMIQWIAPLASESPELIVVTVLVLKARSTAGFNALISSKLNQWTLLIGTLAVVFSIGAGGYGVLPFEFKQNLEIWLTAAQSFFALAILANFEISLREAITLLVLFVTQVLVEILVLRVAAARELLNVTGAASAETLSHQYLIFFTVVYVVAAIGLLLSRREAVRELVARTGATAREAMGREPKAGFEGAD